MNEQTDNGRTIVIWPPSTLWDGPRIRWWHQETCRIQIDNACTCRTEEQ